MKGFYRIIAGAVLALSGVGAIAQTEITADMIWREGTTWTEIRVNLLEPVDGFTVWRAEYELVQSNYGTVDGHDCLAVKKLSYREETYNESEIPDDYFEYYSLSKCDNSKAINPKLKEVFPKPQLQYLYLDGNKVYVYDSEVGKEIMMYDFNTWNEGDTIRSEYVTLDYSYDGNDDYYIDWFSYYDKMFVKTWSMMNLDQEDKYIGKIFKSYKNEVLGIKGIGMVASSYGLINYYHWALATNGDGPWKVIEVKTPELGVVYRHPNYSEYDKYAGVETIVAGGAEPEISVSGDAVTVTSEAEVGVSVYTVTGMEVRRGVCLGSLNVSLNPGLYIVRAGTVTRKVQI